MSTNKITIKSLVMPLLIGAVSILMVSCGTQQQAYNQGDGIYAPRDRGDRQVAQNEETRANYYQQYFQTKSASYQGALSEEDIIFTDTEAYTTSERLDDNGNIIIEENYYDDDYGPWGSNIDNSVVNIYNYGNYGFWRPPFYGYYGGYWGHYPGWGYYGPSWRFSFGWGWGYPYYGYYGGYYPFYHGYYGGYHYPFYYNTGYYNSNVAYNRGRRNTDYNRSANQGRT